VLVNDVHSKLNASEVREIVPVDSLSAIQAALAGSELPVAVAGGRHAMGGQQFCAGGLLLDTRPLSRVLEFDRERGVIEVEAGMQWPQLLAQLRDQNGNGPLWGIRQKQTGANRLSLGGALSANAHGRGLSFPPIVSDIESFTLVGADGEVRLCSRTENADLFALAIGGYGLFGAIYSVRIRLAPRQTLERVVELRTIDGLIDAFASRIAAGFAYGDFQFSIDARDPEFLRRGVFSCYRPVDDATPPDHPRALSRDDWKRLLLLAHTDKAKAWELYASHYVATSGQLYLSDAHQFTEYVDDYHLELDQILRAGAPATEMITELFVPRDRLEDLMDEVAGDFREHHVDLVYGTVRLIERDEETFLAWAREPWACVIFNLHTVHTPKGIAESAEAFRRLIDIAIAHGGSYYLTYHRWARPDQVDACHPRFHDFLAAKQRHDPEERFQSDWYRDLRLRYF
jgi:FAD/FMN-containing dehydrogenase